MQAEWRTRRRILRNYLDGVNLDYDVADSLGMSPAEFRSRVAAKLRSLSFVSDIFTSDELRATDGAARAYLEEQRHSFHPDRSPDLTMQLKPYYLVTDNPHGTTHGSPYAYDTHVPLIFWGERIKPGRIDTPHKTVDLAPTMAHLLHLDLPRLSFTDLKRKIGAQVEAGVDGEVLLMAIEE
jgi:hypothetical protein